MGLNVKQALTAACCMLLLYELHTLRTRVHELVHEHQRQPSNLEQSRLLAMPALAPTFAQQAIPEPAPNRPKTQDTQKVETGPKATERRAPAPAPPPPKAQGQKVAPQPEWSFVDKDTAVVPLDGEGVPPAFALEPSHSRSGRGVLLTAIHKPGNEERLSKPILEALRAAMRMSSVAAATAGLRFGLVTNRLAWEFMSDAKRCRVSVWPDCAVFSDGSALFKDVVFLEDLPGYDGQGLADDAREALAANLAQFQSWPLLWFQKILGTLASPFAQTLVVDSDVYACPGFESLFDEMGDGGGATQQPLVAVMAADTPYTRGNRFASRPGMPEEFSDFTESSLAVHYVDTTSDHALSFLALLRDVYVRHLAEANSGRLFVRNDQTALREALFTMRDRVHPLTFDANRVGCRDSGCSDGCLMVHRRVSPEMSRTELAAWNEEQAIIRKAKQDEKKRLKQEQQDAGVAPE
eukprot:m.490024 g.490024  ORF g.490024 m.490024 type:complete len:465 (+) comp27365_c0_seq1:237-1631(+)